MAFPSAALKTSSIRPAPDANAIIFSSIPHIAHISSHCTLQCQAKIFWNEVAKNNVEKLRICYGQIIIKIYSPRLYSTFHFRTTKMLLNCCAYTSLLFARKLFLTTDNNAERALKHNASIITRNLNGICYVYAEIFRAHYNSWTCAFILDTRCINEDI